MIQTDFLAALVPRKAVSVYEMAQGLMKPCCESKPFILEGKSFAAWCFWCPGIVEAPSLTALVKKWNTPVIRKGEE